MISRPVALTHWSVICSFHSLVAQICHFWEFVYPGVGERCWMRNSLDVWPVVAAARAPMHQPAPSLVLRSLPSWSIRWGVLGACKESTHPEPWRASASSSVLPGGKLTSSVRPGRCFPPGEACSLRRHLFQWNQQTCRPGNLVSVLW